MKNALCGTSTVPCVSSSSVAQINTLITLLNMFQKRINSFDVVIDMIVN